MELLEKLGIDWRLVIAQIINFLVLLFILYKFLYKPILNLLEKRSKKIERGLKDAEKIKKDLEETEEIKEKKILAAKKEAEKIITQANEVAEKNRQEMIVKAKGDVKKVVEESKEQIEIEKQKMLQEAKKELADLVTDASSQVLGKTIDEEIDKKIVEQTVKGMKAD